MMRAFMCLGCGRPGVQLDPKQSVCNALCANTYVARRDLFIAAYVQSQAIPPEGNIGPNERQTDRRVIAVLENVDNILRRANERAARIWEGIPFETEEPEPVNPPAKT